MLVAPDTYGGKGAYIVPTLAKRLTCFAVFCASLSVCLAADLSIKPISSPKLISREPVISETGLAAWSSQETIEAGEALSDIYIYKDGKTRALTTSRARHPLANIRPQVQSNTVVWVGNMEVSSRDIDWVFREVPAPERDTPVQEVPALYRAMQDDAGNQWFEDIGSGPESTNESAVAASVPEDLGTPSAAPVDTNAPATAVPDAAQAPAPQPDTNVVEGLDIIEPPADSGYPTNELRRAPSGDTEICMWDGGDEIKRITRDNRDDLGPSVWGSLIAWQKAKGWPFGWEIMIWADGFRNQLTTNYYYDMAPKVHGPQVVWYGWDGHDFEIYLYDHTKGTTTQITSNQYDDVSPSIWDGVVAWEGYPGSDADIFMWKDGQTQKLSDNIEDDLNPKVWNGRVVWQGFDGDDFEIYLYDGEKTIKLTSNTYDDLNPDIADNMVCWMGYNDNWDAEIYAWDLTGKPIRAAGKDDEYRDNRNTGRLTFNDFEDRNPHTAAGRVIWQSDEDDKSIIYLAEPQ